MQNLKDKMFNYEVTPPKQSWDIIAGTLNAEKTDTQFTGKKINKKFTRSSILNILNSCLIVSTTRSPGPSNKK